MKPKFKTINLFNMVFVLTFLFAMGLFPEAGRAATYSISMPSFVVASLDISTDKLSYLPGETVTISASMTPVVWGFCRGSLTIDSPAVGAVFPVGGLSGTATFLASTIPGTYQISFTARAVYKGTGRGSCMHFAGLSNSLTYTVIAPTGTITTSSNIASSWTITGPATITGSGTLQTSTSQPTGTYTITWGAVSGYTTPVSQSLTLTSGGVIAFSGTYTAACSANSGTSCTSSSNSCSQTNSGTYNCSGVCSASTPANPWYLGVACSSSSNSCGQTNSGAYNCSGTCSATTPANPWYLGVACSSSPNSCGMTNSGTYNCGGTCSASAPSNSLCVATCSNGATNPTTCDQCPINQAYYLSFCTACGNGGCTGTGGSASNPNGGLTCSNGATNVPPMCVGTCANRATNWSTCDTCPAGQAIVPPVTGVCTITHICNNNYTCDKAAGETFLNCPSDCPMKYQQF